MPCVYLCCLLINIGITQVFVYLVMFIELPHLLLHYRFAIVIVIVNTISKAPLYVVENVSSAQYILIMSYCMTVELSNFQTAGLVIVRSRRKSWEKIHAVNNLHVTSDQFVGEPLMIGSAKKTCTIKTKIPNKNSKIYSWFHCFPTHFNRTTGIAWYAFNLYG